MLNQCLPKPMMPIVNSNFESFLKFCSVVHGKTLKD
jgi:hypothetical protein